MNAACQDRSVSSLLSDQDEKVESHVVQAIEKILCSVDDPELKYAERVRSLTKALSIVNEKHRQANA